MTTKSECIELLNTCDLETIKGVLHANNIKIQTNKPKEKYIHMLVDSIWNQSHTPISEMVTPKSMEEIIQIYSRKLDLPIDPKIELQTQLNQLRTRVMANCSEIDFTEIPPETLERLQRSVLPSLLGVGAAGGAATTRWAAYKVLSWTASKWVNIIKIIPQLGPAIVTIRSTAGVLARVSGPVGIVLAIWSINNSLGPKWDRCLGLLIGFSFCLDESSKNKQLILPPIQ